ncbi:MAG: cell division protein ZipA C-terminal FtsZ-binding domain-containing protein [Steroidobacteraceae bacterium]
MPELRLILLALGVALIVGLYVRERRRGRAGRSTPDAATPVPAASPQVLPPSAIAPPAPVAHPPVRPSHEVPQDLPVIEVDDSVDIDLSFAKRPPGPAVPVVTRLAEDLEAVQTDGDEGLGPVVERPAGPASWQAPAHAPIAGADLVLDWPPESERRILALRVLPRSGERFAGRSLRQALAGEGFMHGPMEIFHLPADDGRVLLSAASLMRPGVFHPGTMDTERFAGINVFAVLPGALPDEEIFDRLVEATRGLAARLNAELRDQHGEPLTTARVVALRAQYAGTSA